MANTSGSKSSSKNALLRWWWLIPLLALITLGAQWSVSQWLGDNAPTVSADFPYQIDQPAQNFTLSTELSEISGLTVMPDGRLLAVQDEKGLIYVLDLETGEIQEKIKFHKSGDYEGIATADNKVYVLQSDGDLFVIKDLEAANEAKKIETSLSIENDTEGLTATSDGRLLIACKGDSRIDDNKKDHRAIFVYDPGKDKLKKEPFFDLKIKDIRQLAGDEKNAFRPSGIALHPITGDYYLLASVGKLLLVVDAAGQLKEAVDLRTGDFLQPEGIAFLSNGDLLISNEAHVKGGRPNLLRFTYQPVDR
ncbi:MAG: SdiA-regulated domain-containing protein [Salibacteraceae bacterium]